MTRALRLDLLIDWLSATRARVVATGAVCIVVTALAVPGCGAGNFLNVPPAGRQSRTARTHRLMSSALCGWHAWRFYEDARHGHAAYAAFQAWRTVHNCRRALRR
jgi:hypothetical protein